MNKRLLMIIAAVVVVALILVFVVAGRDNATPTTQTNTSTEQTSTEATEEAQVSQPPASNLVTYTGNGFSPSELTVAKGTTVTFKNDSSGVMWVASDPHPQHTNYPEFDSGKYLQPGESYSFTFEQTGSWGFHHHAKPAHIGTIIVE